MEKLTPRMLCRPSKNRRAVHRLLCSDLVRVAWTGEHGTSFDELAVVEDFSPQGASLFLGVPVPDGAPIHLHTSGGMVRGTCRHCSPAPNGYLAGLVFEDGA